MKQSNSKKQGKITIAIIGEHPNNDSLALSYLLKDVVHNHVQFTFILTGYRGSDLDSKRFLNDLRAEFRAEEPQYVILVRDLDGFLSDKEKLRGRDEWFKKANGEIKNSAIFFLAIYTMEALILADIIKFNAYYKLKMQPIGDPMMKERPKEYIQSITHKTQKGKYEEKHAPKIFQTLDFKTVYDNHKGERSFQAFANELMEKKLLKDKKEW